MGLLRQRFVVVAGGVISGVGKGVATASIGALLQSAGYSISVIKIDPYINYDAGTLRPTEHGEVWVTADGGEIDQDLGTYERFLNIEIPKKNSITTGQIYASVIQKERSGNYLGQTVQFVPHIIDEIINRILFAASGYDITLIEIGGTIGDYENSPFFFALKALERRLGYQSISYILVSYFPVPGHINEMKTKPTQQAVRLLMEQGVFPDLIICRSAIAIDDVRKKKIEESAHIKTEYLIAAPDVATVYEIPLLFDHQMVGQKVLNFLGLSERKKIDLSLWKKQVDIIISKSKKVTIGIVGKYITVGDFHLTDSYLSVYHALLHAATAQGLCLSVEWINSQDFETKNPNWSRISNLDGVVVPGGFGSAGVEGIIAVIEYVRNHKIHFLGLCYGMQLAVVEFARNVCGFVSAHTTEVDPKTPYPVIDFLPLQEGLLEHNQYGGTMRLGAYAAIIKNGTRIQEIYQGSSQATIISDQMYVTERHRHRYEVNNKYVECIENKGGVFSGYFNHETGIQLMEFFELHDHPFFISTQAHPEFTSRFAKAHPLFLEFIKASNT